jgi:predicted transcriptional regulator YdeE
MNPIRFEEGRPMLLAGLRRRHPFDAVDLAAQWRAFDAELPGRAGANRFGVMCGADDRGFEYMCAVEVESFAGLPEGTGRMRVPAQRYAVFAHDGPPETLRSTWMAIFAWLERGQYASAHTPDFEVYGPDGGIEVRVGVVAR